MDFPVFNMSQKNINALSQEDLKKFPVWKYVDRSSSEVSSCASAESASKESFK
jgi:hypothetical protein